MFPNFSLDASWHPFLVIFLIFVVFFFHLVRPWRPPNPQPSPSLHHLPISNCLKGNVLLFQKHLNHHFHVFNSTLFIPFLCIYLSIFWSTDSLSLTPYFCTFQNYASIIISTSSTENLLQSVLRYCWHSTLVFRISALLLRIAWTSINSKQNQRSFYLFFSRLSVFSRINVRGICCVLCFKRYDWNFWKLSSIYVFNHLLQ